MSVDFVPDDLVSLPEMARALGRSESTLRLWRLKGLIPEPIKFSATCHRWPRRVLNDLIEQQQRHQQA